MRSKKALFRFAVVAALDGLLLTAVAGCDKGPTQPSRTDPQVRSQQTTPPSQPTALTISVTGTTRLANPGDTSQLTATVRYSDGTTRDVTAEAEWQTQPLQSRILTVKQGLVTAVGYGTVDVEVRVPSIRSTFGATVHVRVQPEGTFLLMGRVTEQGKYVITDASVRVTSGAQTFTAKTDFLGIYIVPAAGDVTVTVEKDGYTTQSKQLTVQGNQNFNVDLQGADREAFSRMYTLTITASASCATLPPEVMQRRYNAKVTELADGSLIVDLSGADFIDWIEDAGFIGRRNGTQLHFDFGAAGHSTGHALLELLRTDTILSYDGTADGTAEETKLVATLNGAVTVTDLAETGPNNVIASCKASDHRLEFVRVGT